MSNARSTRPSESITIGIGWLTVASFLRRRLGGAAVAKVQPLGCTNNTQPDGCGRRSRGGYARGRLPRAPGGGLGGADGAGAARGVVRERGGARRAPRRRGRLPLGRRRRAARDGARSRAGGAARARLGRRGRGGLHARGGARGHSPARARALARVVDRARAPRSRVDAGSVDRVFAALGDSGRRELVREISERGSATATELAAVLPVTRQAVAKQLAALA